MDLTESIVMAESETDHSLADGVLAIVAARRSGNEALANQLVNALQKSGVDSYLISAMVHFIMCDDKKEISDHG